MPRVLPVSFLPLPLLLLALALAAAQPAVAAKAHEHGLARLDVGVEPGRITLDLDTPLDNLLGFERAPRDEAERAKADAVIRRLRDGAALFRIDPAAGCTLAQVELTSAALQLGSAAGPARAGHDDVEGHYAFSCKAGARAGFIEVGLFEALGGLRRIELQLATPRGQVKATLLRPASRVNLVR